MKVHRTPIYEAKKKSEIKKIRTVTSQEWRGRTLVQRIIDVNYKPFICSTGHGFGIE